MTMYARIIPDKMGRPNYIQFSSHAKKMIGENTFLLIQKDDTLILEINKLEGNYKLGKTGRIAAWRTLDPLNAKKQLHGDTFPIKRDGNDFILFVRQSDPELARNNSRMSAVPMAFMPPKRLQKNPLTTEEFVKVFALAEHVLGEPITEAMLTAEREGVLAALPAMSSIQGRFGGFSRLRQFMDYQIKAIQTRGVDVDTAKSQLAGILEKGVEE